MEEKKKTTKKVTKKEEVKKTTTKKAPVKKETTKKVVEKKVTPKKNVEKVEKKKVVKKTTEKKTTPKKEVKKETTNKSAKKEETKSVVKVTKVKEEKTPKKETKKSVVKATKVAKASKDGAVKVTKVVKKDKNRFLPNDDAIKVMENNKKELDKVEYLDKVYNTAFNYFTGQSIKYPTLQITDEEIKNLQYTMAFDLDVAVKFNEAKKDSEKWLKENITSVSKQVDIDDNTLIDMIATKLHKEWCEDELASFYGRLLIAFDNGTQGLENGLQAACYSKGKKRNDVMYDYNNLMANTTNILNSLRNYEEFKNYVGYDKDSLIQVKKYVKRRVPSEQRQYDFKVSTGEENILRDFDTLSTNSKFENINVATACVNTYKMFVSAGMGFDYLDDDIEYHDMIGKAINVDLMSRSDERKKYDSLTKEDKEKNFNVFNILLGIVKEHPEEFRLYQVSGFKLPDLDALEEKIFNGEKIEDEEVIDEMAENIVNEVMSTSKNRVNNKVMGYTVTWTLALLTGVLSAGLFILGAFYLG